MDCNANRTRPYVAGDDDDAIVISDVAKLELAGQQSRLNGKLLPA
jgi:hypothetical protein